MTERVVVLGRDFRGWAVGEYSGVGQYGPFSFRYYVTECCGADGKGVEHGVACRACYRPLPIEFGGEPGELETVFGDGISVERFRELVKA